MKRILMNLLFFVSLILLAGCSFAGQTEEDITLVQTGFPSYDDQYVTVGFIQTGKESDWRDANSNDFLNTFTKENGYELIFVNGNSSSERQVKAMYDLIHQRVDYIIIDPLIEDGWDEVIQKAYDSHIPVIVSDRNVSTDSSLYTCWIGSDFHAEGINAIVFLEDYLVENNRQDEQINIVILEGTKGSSAELGRTAGLKEKITRHPNWNIITSRSANFTQGEGQSVMEDILLEQDDIDVLIAENDNMMFGAMKAMDRYGVSYGVNGKVITISFDCLYEAFEKMIDGSLHASVECNPLLAELTEKAIRRLENGEEIERIYYSEESIYTYKNAARFINERRY
jgi:simple sugar transport system substrate-binding protein